MSTPPEYFAELFADNDDPWAFRQRWYEQRKRDLTLACLPRQRYPRAFEAGCANGELSLALAGRCDALLAMDLDPRAVTLAGERLAVHPHAQVRQGRLPEDWPAGHFELIVLSEVGYYLAAEPWRQMVEHCRSSLAPGGTLLACHWLAPIDGAPQHGRQVHAVLDNALRLPKLLRHEEPDFLLELWSDGGGPSLDERVS